MFQKYTIPKYHLLIARQGPQIRFAQNCNFWHTFRFLFAQNPEFRVCVFWRGGFGASWHQSQRDEILATVGRGCKCENWLRCNRNRNRRGTGCGFWQDGFQFLMLNFSCLSKKKHTVGILLYIKKTRSGYLI